MATSHQQGESLFAIRFELRRYAHHRCWKKLGSQIPQGIMEMSMRYWILFNPIQSAFSLIPPNSVQHLQ